MIRRVFDWLPLRGHWLSLRGKGPSLRGDRLGEKVVRSTIWLAIGNGSAKIVNLLKIAVLGRLLAPDDFGLMAIAILTLKWLEYFTETGFNKALVQEQGDIGPYLDTAWVVQLARGCLLAVLLFVTAPFAADFFATPHATAVIRACAMVLIIRGFANPAMVYLRRELDFKRIFWWTLSNAVVGLVVAICAARLYPSVWALVASVIAAAVASTVFSYLIVPYMPRPHFRWQHAKALIRFGKWIFFLSVIAFFGLYADSAIVGKVLGMTSLGFYQIARQFGMTHPVPSNCPAREWGDVSGFYPPAASRAAPDRFFTNFDGRLHGHNPPGVLSHRVCQPFG